MTGQKIAREGNKADAFEKGSFTSDQLLIEQLQELNDKIDALLLLQRTLTWCTAIIASVVVSIALLSLGHQLWLRLGL